jgi:hypothetical protein
VPAATYHAMLQSLGVSALTPSLAQLCPDLPLRRQLLALYEVIALVVSLSLHQPDAGMHRSLGSSDADRRSTTKSPRQPWIPQHENRRAVES